MEGKRRVGRMLHRIELLMRYHLRTQGAELIPPAQMRMLEFIAAHEGCNQAEVAEEMGVSPASVAQSIKRMEAAGHVTRDAVQGNLRANSLRITEIGAAAARDCRLVFDGLEERMLAGMTEGEQAELYTLLKRLIENMESADTGAMNNMELCKLLDSGKGGADV